MNTKLLLTVWIGFFGSVAIFGAFDENSDNKSIIACAILAGVPLGFIIWRKTRKDIAPNFLDASHNKIYQQYGISFTLSLHSFNGHLFATVHYQNRYERAGSISIRLKPIRRSFRKSSMPPLSISFDFDQAEVGKYQTPLAYPSSALGKDVDFLISVRERYPAGRGQELRKPRGIKTPSSKINPVIELLKFPFRLNFFTSLLFLGTQPVISYSFPQSLPQGSPPSSSKETLWSIQQMSGRVR